MSFTGNLYWVSVHVVHLVTRQSVDEPKFYVRPSEPRTNILATPELSSVIKSMLLFQVLFWRKKYPEMWLTDPAVHRFTVH